MEFEQAFEKLKYGENVRSITNTDWNGVKTGRLSMKVKIKEPETSGEVYHLILVTESKEFDEQETITPWVPSTLDLFTDKWVVNYKENKEDNTTDDLADFFKTLSKKGVKGCFISGDAETFSSKLKEILRELNNGKNL